MHASGVHCYLCFTVLYKKEGGISTYLTSIARANIPAARGAEADVPVCESVHLPCRSVVTYNQTSCFYLTSVYNNIKLQIFFI